MRVIDVKVSDQDELLLLIDRIPPVETLEFRKVRIDNPAAPGYLYVAEQDGYVDFLFQHDPGHPLHGQGFNGRQFHLRLDDGTAETLNGPMSASTRTVNQNFPELAARDVVITDSRAHFDDGMVTAAGAITAALWDELADRVERMTEQARQRMLQQMIPDDDAEIRWGTGLEPDPDPAEVLADQGLVLLSGYGYAIPHGDHEQEVGRHAGHADSLDDPGLEIDLP